MQDTHPSVSELYIVDFILHSRVKIDEGRFFIKYVSMVVFLQKVGSRV